MITSTKEKDKYDIDAHTTERAIWKGKDINGRLIPNGREGDDNDVDDRNDDNANPKHRKRKKE